MNAQPVLPASDSELPAYLSVRQVARYLQINEKKVYALLREGAIPATKVTGKWLFPRRLIDQWLLESTHGGVLADRLLITGSDDPLLHRLVTALAGRLRDQAAVLYTPTGTRLGLSLLARRRADGCTLHWGPARESQHRHPALLRRHPEHRRWALLRLYLREQGLMTAPGLAGSDPEHLFTGNLRWVLRQEGAGSQRYLVEALQAQGMDVRHLNVVHHAHSEREAAAHIAMGEADLAPGVRSAASESGLGFITLGWEAFDLAIRREVYFRSLFQHLLQALRAPETAATAESLGGYDLGPAGELVWAA